MKPLILGVCAMTASILPALAAENTDLPVSRVAVFSSGVAYFECDATVSGNTQAELKFRTDQINDIIKSMVVQDFSGGKVGIIGYASQSPIDITLRSFAVDLTGKPTLGDLLTQLRGEPVEITAPRAIKGTVVGVDKSQILSPDGKTLQVIERLDVLTDRGLETVDLTQLQGIKLLNEKIDSELQKALATLASGHDADKKTVVINFEGQGERKVRAAYLLEAPIWKTSYRLVLSDQKDKKPFIQGWATVDNATESDWNNVRLSLVSGRPISFRMDMYTPLYVPRPLEKLELYASLRPPEYEGGWAAETAKAPVATPAPAGGAKGGAARAMAKRGEFNVTQGLRAAPEAAMMARAPATVELAGAGVESFATAQEAGELFAYHIEMPVSIQRQHSAMLPIVNQDIEAQKIDIFNPATHPKYPLNGLELKNTTGLNLMQGPVTVFDANTYAGDALLPNLKPDEKRLIAYALDLSTEVLVKQKSTPEEIVSLKIAKGTLWHQHKFVDTRDYEIKNLSDKERTLIIEQPYSEDWKLVEPKEPYERTANLLRFKVQVPASKTISQTVTLERIAEQSTILSNVGPDDIRIFLKARTISPKLKAALEKIIAMRTELDDIARQRAQLEKQAGEAVTDQARIRENLKVLDKSTDAYQRQLKAFDEVDSRIGELRKQVLAARDQEEQKRKALEDYLASLDVE
jgi:hypothetical protein